MKLPSDWELTLFINNLTNEELINSYAYNSYASDLFGVETWRLFEFTQRPRHYGLSIRKQF
jgi:outer membrane receptor protein involved in Fe transport